MAKKSSRTLARLICQACQKVNYYLWRKKGEGKKKLNLNKYCPSCLKHTEHKETKK